MGEQKCLIFQSGEIVRDLGVIQLYTLLREIDVTGELNAKLTNNYLEFNANVADLETKLFDYFIYNILYQGFINDLSVEKLEDDLLNAIQQDNHLENLEELLVAYKVPSSKITAIMKKRESLYFPYLRNSGKFGANSQSIANFHLNLKTMISLFLESISATSKEYQKYGEGQQCSICHLKTAPFYDITHKYEIDMIEKLPKRSRQERTDSKYLYSFRGGQHNSFNSYGGFHVSSSICFECEFFNLLFLSYVKLQRPRYLVYCYDLSLMRFLQEKIILKQTVYSYQALHYHIAQMAQNSRVKLYQIRTDANKGVLLENESTIDYQQLSKQIKVMDLIDSFILREGTKSIAEVKKTVKNYALSNNNEMVYSWMLSNIVANDGQSLCYNYRLLCQLIEELKRGGLDMGETIDELKKTGTSFKAFGKKFSTMETKNNLAFRLNQLVKSNNRTEIAYILRHLFISKQKVTKESSEHTPVWLPQNFSEKISEATNKDLSYYIGCFIEGLYLTTKGETN